MRIKHRISWSQIKSGITVPNPFSQVCGAFVSTFNMPGSAMSKPLTLRHIYGTGFSNQMSQSLCIHIWKLDLKANSHEQSIRIRVHGSAREVIRVLKESRRTIFFSHMKTWLSISAI